MLHLTAAIIFAQYGVDVKSYDLILAIVSCTSIALAGSMIAFVMTIMITVFGLPVKHVMVRFLN